jgi:8-oxo-dGTP pyrophosphatase MutT (NUDIX family)
MPHEPESLPATENRNIAAPGPSAGQARPEITVAAITETDGRFLVVEERINQRLVFNQPAGHVEPGETLMAAIIREVREETAWRFQPTALIGVYLWRSPQSGVTTMRFTFCGGVDDHRARQPLDHGIVGTHWLSHADLRQREQRLRSPLVLRCIEDYLGGKRHPLTSFAHLDLHTAALMPAVAV